MSNNEFIDNDIPHEPNLPNSGMPSAFQPGQSGLMTMTPEQLEMMITNPREHPQIKENAKRVLKQMFPEYTPSYEREEVKETPSREVPDGPDSWCPKCGEPRCVCEQPKTNPMLSSIPTSFRQTQNVSDSQFENILSLANQELHHTDVYLLSDPSVCVKLRAMTVAEYKFLARQVEIYERSIRDKKLSVDDFEKLEFGFTESLDLILQKCITNNVDVGMLTMFDWLYLLLALRCISRGSDCSLSYTEQESNKRVKITIDINKLLDHLKQNVSLFMRFPVCEVDLKDGIKLYTILPTRAEMKAARNIYFGQNTEDDPLNYITLSLSLKGYVQNQTLYMLPIEKRRQLFSVLNYDKIEKIQNRMEEIERNFYDVINEYIHMNHDTGAGLTVSDFIFSSYIL